MEVFVFRRRNLLGEKLLSRFVVTMTNGGMISGLLREFDAERYVFVDVKLLSDAGPTAVAGDLYIDRTRVDYMQSVTDAAV